MAKNQLRLIPLTPISTATTFEATDGDVASIVFRNAGDSTVNLWNGAYTLDSKETISFNVTDDISSLVIQNIPISFSGGTTNKLQIVVLKSAPSSC